MGDVGCEGCRGGGGEAGWMELRGLKDEVVVGLIWEGGLKGG